MKSKFRSSTDSNEKRMIHTKTDNSEIMIGKDTDEIIKKRFDFICIGIKYIEHGAVHEG